MNKAFISFVKPETMTRDTNNILYDYNDRQEYAMLVFWLKKDHHAPTMDRLDNIIYLTHDTSKTKQLLKILIHCYCWANVDTVIPFRNADDIRKNNNSWLNTIIRKSRNIEGCGKFFARIMLIDILLRTIFWRKP